MFAAVKRNLSYCPQCKEQYSTSISTNQRKIRSRLPLALQCGHGVCYQCAAPKRPQNNQKYASDSPSNEFSEKEENLSVCCSVCMTTSVLPLESFQNILPLVDCYRLGLVRVEELGVEIAGENICFKGIADRFSQNENLQDLKKRTPSVHPGDCSIHNLPLDYWCYEDEGLLCKLCRLSLHLNHDVVKMKDKNQEELDDFYKAADRTFELTNEMKETRKRVKERVNLIQEQCVATIKEMRRYFEDLHAVLAAREQEAQSVIAQIAQQYSSPFKSIGKHLFEACSDITSQLKKASLSVNNVTASKETVKRWTESLNRFQFYEPAIRDTLVELESVALSLTLRPLSEFATKLRYETIISIDEGENDENKAKWAHLQNLFVDLQRERNREIVNEMNAMSPDNLIENKRARKNVCPNSSSASKIVSQAANGYNKGTNLRGVVTQPGSPFFYIQIQGESLSDLERLQAQMQLHEKKPAPRLQELNWGQLVACRYSAKGQWYRALIEEVNLKCDDVAVFFVDIGSREFTTVQNIRLLTDNLAGLPAQSIRCAFVDNPADATVALLRTNSNNVELCVDRVDPGGVGCLDDSELTLWLVTVCVEPPVTSPVPERISSPEVVDPLAWPTCAFKEKSSPTPPPPSVAVKRKKRFPASKLSSNILPIPPPIVLPPAPYQGQENRHRTKVTIIHCGSPGDFTVRVDSGELSFNSLKQYFENQFVFNTYPLEPPELEPGLVCAIQLEQWNRCQIIRVDSEESILIWLMDLGRKSTVARTQLFRMNQARWLTTPSMALQCRLWGVQPAGHPTNWSHSSIDRMKDVIKTSTAIFVQVYFIQEEETEEGFFIPIHFVRFFYEHLLPGGPLECDVKVTGCLNDELFEDGLALRQPMFVSVQPSPLRWLPSLSLPHQLEAIPIWITDDCYIYIHRVPGPSNHLEAIKKLLNWHYARSTPSLAELSHWEKDEPCVAKCPTEDDWCRGVVVSASDESQTASVLCIDYGNIEKNIEYKNMRKSLVGYEYAAQATRCRFAKYPGPDKKPTDEELDLLHDLLVDKRCEVRVDMSSGEPVIGIQPVEVGARDMEGVFELLRPTPTPTLGSSSIATSPTPTPTILLSSTEHSDFDVDSEFSDDVYPLFHFDTVRETAVYRPLFVPDHVFLPIRIVGVVDEIYAIIQPTRHALNDSPQEWYEQVDSFGRMDTELQVSAELFPAVEVVDHGSPCACRNPADDHWYRGIVMGFADDSLHVIRVELVDIGAILDLPTYEIRQLPTEYLNVPRHSAKSRLIDYPIHPMCLPDLELFHLSLNEGAPLRAFFKENKLPLEMSLYFKDGTGRFIPALESE